MSWIQVNQAQVVEAVPAPASLQYRLVVEVVAASGIDRELFMYRVTDDGYSHVAGVTDLQVYPNNKAEAQAQDVLFYRAPRTELVLTSQITAARASEGIQARLARVNRDWGALGTTPFGGVDTFVYDSADE